MILQITETATGSNISAPVILLMVLLFIAASVISGFIAYRMRTKSLRIGRENEKDDAEEKKE